MERRPFQPVLRGLLLSGGPPIYLRAEPGGASEPAIALESAAESGPEWAVGTQADTRALWWPPSKIAARYLGPYLADARPVPLGSAPLRDRGRPAKAGEGRRARTPGSSWRSCSPTPTPRCGDYAFALRTLEGAEALAGDLPAEYEAKRRAWEAAPSSGERAP